MSDSLNEFQRKIKNRQFAIDNSWRGKPTSVEKQQTSTVASPEEHLRQLLNQNISEANGIKTFDGYLPIVSHRKLLGGAVVFCKKAMRKLLKIFGGWYLFPLYERLSCFHGKVVNALSLQRDLSAKLKEQLNALCQEKNQLNAQIQELTERVSQLKEQTVGQGERISQMIKVDEELTGRLDNYADWFLALEAAETSAQERLAALDSQLKRLENLPTDDDEFYHNFEEKFRGSVDEIRDRLRVYVPIIRESLPDWSQGRFVDVGSGRGEWLDLLRENGAVDYVGVDLNQRQNAICAANGHQTVCMDCIRYLAEQPEGNLDLITGFQIIEHLAMSDLMELLRQSYRALKHGGMILFETQNPRNLIVGADTFYIDPSHKRPLPAELTAFFAEWAGFGQVRCIDANSCSNWMGVTQTAENQSQHELVRQFNNVNFKLYGPQDYAIFAVKE